MVPHSNDQHRDAVQDRAISYVRSKFGNLADLPREVVAVIWVTTFRGIETAIAVEAAGGQAGLVRSTLVEGSELVRDLEAATLRMELLLKMVPIIRSASSPVEKAADCSLLIDILKWGTVDAANMSMTDRIRARSFAKADDEYRNAVPDELIQDDDTGPVSAPAVGRSSIVKWMKSVFGPAKNQPGRSTGSSEADAVFQKIDRFLSDEAAQNDRLPESVRSQIEGGLNCDEIPGAIGDFGRDHQNPIPVNGPIGEILYLSNLRTANHTSIMFHRIGSKNGCDAFETVSIDGISWDVLFLNLYHPRKSCRAPSGYTIAQGKARQAMFMGTAEFVDGFPRHIQDAARDAFQQWVGIPMRTPELRHALEQGSFERPTQHRDRLNSILKYLDMKEM